MNIKVRHPEKVNKPVSPIKKKPEWIRSKIVDSQIFFQTKQVVNQNNLVTVCQEANCPNITECWSKKHATFMIMGDTCTRACAFCDVKTGKPTNLDIFEPAKISNAVRKLNLKQSQIKYENRDHALYIAFAPYKDPRYSISVLIEHGGSGSKAAAPLASKLIKKIIDRHDLREQTTKNNLTLA